MGEGVVRENCKREGKGNVRQRLNKGTVKQIVVLLEDGASLAGKYVIFANDYLPRGKVFFRGRNQKVLWFAVDLDERMPSGAMVIALKAALNERLDALYKQALLEFPDWLEQYGVKAAEGNPCYNLDDVRMEFKRKRGRFIDFQIAGVMGFFSTRSPYTAKFNRVVHIEMRESA